MRLPDDVVGPIFMGPVANTTPQRSRRVNMAVRATYFSRVIRKPRRLRSGVALTKSLAVYRRVAKLTTPQNLLWRLPCCIVVPAHPIFVGHSASVMSSRRLRRLRKPRRGSIGPVFYGRCVSLDDSADSAGNALQFWAPALTLHQGITHR